MQLTAYIDESGHSAEARIVSLASFVQDASTWSSFDVAWCEALAHHDAPFLHMREFAHRRGVFQGWTEPRRRSLLAALVSAITSHELVAVGVAIDIDGFTALPDVIQRGLVDPFICCMQEVVYGLAVLGERRGGCSAVFSRQDQFRASAERLWAHLRERDGFEPGLRGISFQDMRAIPGLQAADLLAYELRHFYDRRSADPHSKPRWPFMQIVADQTSRDRRLLKYLPAWYLEMQASADFEQQMGQLMRHPATAAHVMLELWPQF